MKAILAVFIVVAIIQHIAKSYSINSISQFKEFAHPSK
jgi:hypothetical protein